jgi:hypothetical protein
MTRIPVISTVIASVGYDPASFQLEIEFHSGKVYNYFNIPLATYEGLMEAESQGSYFCENIRRVGYFERVE